MVKKGLIAVGLFYLLGLFGVAGSYLSDNWDDEWGATAQIMDAIQSGATWPIQVIELIVGA